MDPSQDRLSPEVKRSVYFGDLELTRHEAVRDAGFMILFAALSVAMMFAGPGLRGPIWLMAALSRTGLAGRSIRDWQKLRAKADGDGDLIYDVRLATEDRHAPFIRGMGTMASGSRIVMLIVLSGLVLRGLGLKF
jgi:hypothetical protein